MTEQPSQALQPRGHQNDGMDTLGANSRTSSGVHNAKCFPVVKTTVKGLSGYNKVSSAAPAPADRMTQAKESLTVSRETVSSEEADSMALSQAQRVHSMRCGKKTAATELPKVPRPAVFG